MREINNNTNKVDVTNLKKSDVKPSTSEIVQADSVENKTIVSDFSNPTEVLGRSQVPKSDNLKEDLKFGLANPQAIASSDKFFDMAYAHLQANGDKDAYEKAACLSSAFAKELV